ncbi:MAG TPA: hypothetical protein VIH90_00475 [Candidatus Saccharimonadales bacterium]
MAAKTNPTEEPTPQTSKSQGISSRKPIVVRDEEGQDTKKNQVAETKVDQPKIILETKVSPPTGEQKSENEQPSEEEQHPLRKSGPSVIAPLESSDLVADKTTAPSQEPEAEAASVDQTPPDAELDPPAEEVSTNIASDKMKQADKGEQDYEKLEKRHQELEKTIESRKYFVPINTIAQKRSIRVSLILVLLTLLLAILLIDLMFDSGMILLVNRLPHTHFFSVR